ncbi:hypothetical protein AFL94_13825 [Arthrobacter sp. LS16]|nr:hypothetical protein AFL94_13825 [Arthrobacter sp. LS16]
MAQIFEIFGQFSILESCLPFQGQDAFRRQASGKACFPLRDDLLRFRRSTRAHIVIFLHRTVWE